MLNYIVIRGRVTHDITPKKTQSGVSVCNFTVAVDRPKSSGEDKIADFFDVVCWRGLADMVSKHFGKGKEIIVSGSMQSRKWVDDNGNNRYNWEILADTVDFCGSKGNTPAATPNVQSNNLDVALSDSSEDLPF